MLYDDILSMNHYWKEKGRLFDLLFTRNLTAENKIPYAVLQFFQKFNIIASFLDTFVPHWLLLRFLLHSLYNSSLPLSLSHTHTHTHYHSLSLVCQFSLSLSLSHTHTHTHTQSFSLFPGMPININANNTSLETSFSITRQKPLSLSFKFSNVNTPRNTSTA
jgi:hypothetical protein